MEEDPPKKMKMTEDIPSLSEDSKSVQQLREDIKQGNITAVKNYFSFEEEGNKVTDYIKSGGRAKDLINLLSTIDCFKCKNQVVGVFNALFYVIVRTVDSFPDLYGDLTESCKKLLWDQHKLIQELLESANSFLFRKTALKLLTVISLLNEILALEVLSCVSINRDLAETLARPSKPGETDTLREAFTNFILSFILDRKTKTVVKAISMKGVVGSLLSHLRSDPKPRALSIISALKSIASNKDVPKILRLQIFCNNNLSHLLSVYAWNPNAVEVIKKKRKKKIISSGEPKSEELAEVREAVHDLLLLVCTSSKLGVAFVDHSYGTGSVVNNILLNMIKGIPSIWNDCLVEDLVASVLRQSPDLIRHFLPSLDDHLTTKPFQTYNFIVKVLKEIKVNITELSDKTCWKVVQTIFANSTILKAASDKVFLCSDDKEMRQVATNLLATLLNILRALKEVIETEQKAAENFSENLQELLRNNLQPAPVLIDSLNLWEKDASSEGTYLTLNSLLLYHELCPELLTPLLVDGSKREVVIDIAEKLVGKTNQASLTQNIPLVAIKLCLLTCGSDPRQPEFMKILDNLAKLISASEGESLKPMLEVLKDMLRSTNYFTTSEHELDIWIKAVSLFPKSSSWICSAVRYSNGNLSELYQVLAKAEEVVTEENDELASALSLDDYLAMNEEKCGARVDNSIYTRLNISPFLPAVLEMVRRSSDPDLEEFSVYAIIHLFHYQVSIQAYISLLKPYSLSKALLSVMTYLQSWKLIPAPLTLSLAALDMFSMVSHGLLYDDLPVEKFEKILTQDPTTIEMCLRQIIFNLTRLSSMQAATDGIVQKSLPLLKCLLEAQPVPHNILGHPHLIRDFHPAVKAKNSNLTEVVFLIVKSTDFPQAYLAPYSARFVFELKMAIASRKLWKSPVLEEAIRLIPPSPKKTRHLLMKLIKLDISELVQDQSVPSNWVLLESKLIDCLRESKVTLSNEELCSLTSQLINLCRENSNISPLLESFCRYVQSISDPDFYGIVGNHFRDLFECLCTSKYWHEELAKFLLKFVDHAQLPIFDSICPSRSIPLASASLLTCTHKCFDVSALLSSHSSQLKSLLCSTEGIPNWLKDYSNLIKDHLDVGVSEKISRKIEKNKEEVFLSPDSLQLICQVFKKASLNPSLAHILHFWMEKSLNESTEARSADISVKLVESLKEEEVANFSGKLSEEHCKKIILLSFKSQTPSLIEVLRLYIHHQASQLNPAVIFELLIGHSKFVNVLLGNSNDFTFQLLRLILKIVELDGSVAMESHIALYLSAYKASLSKVDQVILRLLVLYETQRISLSALKPFVWGEAASDVYQVKKNPTLTAGSAIQTLNLLDLDRVEVTIAHYSLKRTLDDIEIIEAHDEVYDPAFILPVLGQILAEDTDHLKIRLVAQSGALALALCFLSSSCEDIRASSYHVIYLFNAALAQSRHNTIWVRFIEFIRNGVAKYGDGAPNTRLSSIVSVFLARSSIVFADPCHFMYGKLTNYFFTKQSIDLTTVPEFLEIFNSTEPKYHRMQRVWILNVLKDGIREQSDLQMALHTYVIKLILDFHSCSLASLEMKGIIEEIIVKCVTCIDSKKILLNDYSILCWLSHGMNKQKLLEKLKNLRVPSNYKNTLEFIQNKYACKNRGVALRA